MRNTSIKKLVFSALLLAAALLLPFLTGQIQQFGNMLLPMHIPVLLCGFVCGGGWGAAVGLIAPLLRSFLFGMPPLFPVAAAMAVELAVYGFVTGFLYSRCKKNIAGVFISLLTAMVLGRILWGAAYYLMTMGTGGWGWQAFISGAVLTAVPGIIIQLVLIPVIVLAIQRAQPIPLGAKK